VSAYDLTCGAFEPSWVWFRLGLLVACLRAIGRKVYAINPLSVARYREGHTVARSKSDHADAMTLANILRDL
jgi:hypothetical protein